MFNDTKYEKNVEKYYTKDMKKEVKKKWKNDFEYFNYE